MHGVLGPGGARFFDEEMAAGGGRSIYTVQIFFFHKIMAQRHLNTIFFFKESLALLLLYSLGMLLLLFDAPSGK